MGKVSEEHDRLQRDTFDWRELVGDSSPVLCQNNLEGKVYWISESLQRVLGFKPEEVIGKDVSAFVHPADAEQVQNMRERSIGGEEIDAVSLRVRHADGSYRIGQARTRPLYDSSGAVRGNVIAWQDLHDRMATMRAFATLAEANRVMLRASSEEMLLKQMCSTITSIGGYSFALYGVAVGDEEKSVRIVAADGDDRGYADSLKVSWDDGPLGQGPGGLAIRTEKTQVRNDLAADPRFAPWRALASSRGIQCCIALPVFVHDKVHGFLAVYSQEANSFDDRAQELLEGLAADLGYGLARYQDAAALTAAEAARKHAVEFDWLTGLAKKSLTIVRIQELIDSQSAQGWALLCVGVDGMTAINQAFNHPAGDAVLVEVAARLVESVDAHELVGRIAGDEFVVILRDVVTATDAEEAAQRFIRDVQGAIQFDGNTIDISACVGIAMFDGQDADALVRDATGAMRDATRQGFGTYAFVDESTAMISRIALETQLQLREALCQGEVTAWYMPVVRLEDSKLFGYEALVRWVKDDGTVITPDRFLPVAERSHSIIEIDRVVLRHAIETLASINPDLHIAVNVSASTMQAGKLETIVRAELEGGGVDPRRLHLEVTETALLNVSETVKHVMREIAALGVTWWLDDFGTGYSSISHLRDLPIHGVKLDQTFTSGLIAGDSHASRLTRGLVGLAAGLNLRTVAEGVETAEQAALLRGQGWEMAQGWHFGKAAPLPA
jgi:diguanylate cyclase (GGDEF)-like protein/PAS domain S-box-containing protein